MVFLRLYTIVFMVNALLMVDHGSKRGAANQQLFEMVMLVRSIKPHLIVYGAHMSLVSPTISEGIASCIGDGATHIVVHPYMLSPGVHAIHDIPSMVKQAVSGYSNVTYEVTAPLGVDLSIAALVLRRSGLHK